MKIYVASVEALREKGKRKRVKLRKPSNLMVFLNAKVFSESHPVYDQTEGSGAVLS